MALSDGRSLGRFAAVLLAGALTGPLATSAEAPSPAKWFDEAVRSDAAGDAPLAFSLYRRAAEAGLPAAEFNVAVMLDSGRGVGANVAEAATWYARAAAHGEARAAYNLGQLYEAGEGVPKNIEIARVWYAASGLVAARERLVASRAKKTDPGAFFEAPRPVAPAADTRLSPRGDGVELVWTSRPQPEPVRYFVELRMFDAEGSHEIFATSIETSSAFAGVPMPDGRYAWRVICAAPRAKRYIASPWARFDVGAFAYKSQAKQ